MVRARLPVARGTRSAAFIARLPFELVAKLGGERIQRLVGVAGVEVGDREGRHELQQPEDRATLILPTTMVFMKSRAQLLQMM